MKRGELLCYLTMAVMSALLLRWFPKGSLDWSLTARIEEAHSDRAHSASERDPSRVPFLSCFSILTGRALENYFGLWEIQGWGTSMDGSSRARRLLKRAVQQGRRRSKNRRRTLLGYVEDSCELRTLLADFFNSLLELVLRHAISECIAGDFEEPACFGDIAARALQRFL